MTKRTSAKLVILLFVVMIVAASCRGPRECWGVSSDAAEPTTEQSGN
ncbi:MAG: hypothetical protein R6V49_01745 [Bacteroidales bacterium]